MRVISGAAGGRTLRAVPGQGTRPTTDKVKEAIFSRIGPYFSGGTVLDLFAGTGGLGIEALSRGMELGIFVDKDRKSIEIIHENLQLTRLNEQAEVYRNDANRAIKVLSNRGLQFDLIFIDPPYKLKNADELMMSLQEGNLLNKSAIIVVEHDAKHSYGEQIGQVHLFKHTVYGDTSVSVYEFNMNDVEVN